MDLLGPVGLLESVEVGVGPKANRSEKSETDLGVIGDGIDEAGEGAKVEVERAGWRVE
jgi:hypothetical protein